MSPSSGGKFVTVRKFEYEGHWSYDWTPGQLLERLEAYPPELVKAAAMLRSIESGAVELADGVTSEDEKANAAEFLFEVGVALQGIAVGLLVMRWGAASENGNGNLARVK